MKFISKGLRRCATSVAVVSAAGLSARPVVGLSAGAAAGSSVGSVAGAAVVSAAGLSAGSVAGSFAGPVVCHGRWKSGRAMGSFTIEAAVVVPMTMLILMAIIFLSFHTHDEVSIVAAAQYAALVQAESSLTGSSGLAGSQQSLSRRLIRATGAGLSVSGNADAVTAEASAGFTVPIPMVDLLTNHALRSISASVQNHSFNGRKKLLLYKSICDGVNDITRGR